jgi:hypothetical protein
MRNAAWLHWRANPKGRGHFFAGLRCTFAYVHQVHGTQCALSCKKMAAVDGYPHSINRPYLFNEQYPEQLPLPVAAVLVAYTGH